MKLKSEILRIIDSLQLSTKYKVMTPVDWKRGDRCMLDAKLTDTDARRLFPSGYEQIALPSRMNYLRLTAQPNLTSNHATHTLHHHVASDSLASSSNLSQSVGSMLSEGADAQNAQNGQNGQKPPRTEGPAYLPLYTANTNTITTPHSHNDSGLSSDLNTIVTVSTTLPSSSSGNLRQSFVPQQIPTPKQQAFKSRNKKSSAKYAERSTSYHPDEDDDGMCHCCWLHSI